MEKWEELGLKRKYSFPYFAKNIFTFLKKLLEKLYQNHENFAENFRKNQQILYFPLNFLQKVQNWSETWEKETFSRKWKCFNDIRENLKCIFIRKRNFVKYKKFREISSFPESRNEHCRFNPRRGRRNQISNWRTQVSWCYGFFTV